MECDFLQLNFGSKLPLNLAEDMLDRHKQIVKSELKMNPESGDALEYKKSFTDNNAFVFDKAIFKKLFDKNADFIVLALGAHLEERQIEINREQKTFNKGSFTIMVAGYKGTCNGDKLEKLDLVDADSIYEYPPSYFVGDLADPLKEKNRALAVNGFNFDDSLVVGP